MPTAQLPDLVPVTLGNVTLSGLNSDITFQWYAHNLGNADATAFTDYRVLLSRDATLDARDIVLTPSALVIPPLPENFSTTIMTTTVRITQAQADALLGRPATVDDLLNDQLFLIVQVDPFTDINDPSDNLLLESAESNTASLLLGRLVDVVLVMDRSGSMSATVPVSGAAHTKLDQLQESVYLFLDLMRRNGGDRLGEVSFNRNVQTIFYDSGFDADGFTDADAAEARDAVQNLTAEGSTNIRDALQRGLDLRTAAGGTSRRRVLIFFSDGRKTAGGDPLDPAFLNQFTSAGVQVFSVGYGTEGGTGLTGIDTELLQALASAGPNGLFHVTESNLELDRFFVQALAGAIGSDVVVDPIADLEDGGVDTVPTMLGSHDRAVSFILTWDNPGLDLDLALRSPSGLEINAGNVALFGDRIKRNTGAGFETIQVAFPLLTGVWEEHGGTWEMIIRNPADAGGATVRYSASAIAESTLHATMDPPRPGSGTTFSQGAAVPLRVQLSSDDQNPVRNATVTVTPNVPLVSLARISHH